VKKALIILIFFSFLFSATELKEFLKLSDLVEHYEEHKKDNKNISFVGFLWMHYSTTSDHDGDAEKDNKLPFKKHDHCFVADNTFSIHKNSSFTFQSPEQIVSASFNSHSSFIPSGISNNIWQPPKFS
jgi:hypothetical protein